MTNLFSTKLSFHKIFKTSSVDYLASMQHLFDIPIFQHFIRYINIICSTMFDILKPFYHICNIAKLLYITFPQLPSASLQLDVCCRRIPGNKASLHPIGCRSTGNKNTPLHVNMQGASLLSDICSADAVFIKLYLARYHSNSIVPGGLLVRS